MSKGLIDHIIDSIFNEELVGRHGEKLTERELKFVRLFGRKGKILRYPENKAIEPKNSYAYVEIMDALGE